MHETSLARAAVAALADAAAGRPVRAVTLAVGTGVDLASAATAWQAAAAGTCLETCQVRWERASDRLRCFSCGHEYDGEPLDQCPSCGGSGIIITRAPELAAVDWIT
jgi:Zn finger protein HypA/HybF involved in hydrogenase expression